MTTKRPPRKRGPRTICAECGRLKQTRGSLRCPSCRARDRQCATCSKDFRSTYKNCNACRSKERACVACGSAFKGQARRCNECRSSERVCVSCGSSFVGRDGRCSPCRQSGKRTCYSCGKATQGTTTCGPCASKVRECIDCGLVIRSVARKCYYCRGTERTCSTCSSVFVGPGSSCAPCRGRMYRGTAESGASYRAKRAKLTPLLSASMRESILAEGPCVYCGAQSVEADHIVPVSRGGTSDPSNLVPACRTCNRSKGNRLLTQWRRDRVRYGLLASPKVKAVYRSQAGSDGCPKPATTTADQNGQQR